MARRLTIKLESLPPRARPLGAAEISNIFGGCANAGPCTDPNKNECCPPTKCQYEPGPYGQRGHFYCMNV